MSASLFYLTLTYQTLGSLFANPTLVLTALLTTSAVISLGYLIISKRPSAMFISSFVIALATVLLSGPIKALDKDVNPQLVANLKLANTFVDKYNMLADKDFIYDFDNDCPLYSFKPGSVCNANAATFPVMTGSGLTVTQLNLGPCACLPPHLHPRGTNAVVSTTGTTHTYLFPEDGTRLIQTMLAPGQLTVFPMGSLHSMCNEGCENNQLYSFLSSDDAGRLTIPNSLWQLGPELWQTFYPFVNVSEDDWNNTGSTQIPPIGTGAINGMQSCLTTCGLNGYGKDRVVRT